MLACNAFTDIRLSATNWILYHLLNGGGGGSRANVMSDSFRGMKTSTKVH